MFFPLNSLRAEPVQKALDDARLPTMVARILVSESCPGKLLESACSTLVNFPFPCPADGDSPSPVDIKAVLHRLLSLIKGESSTAPRHPRLLEDVLSILRNATVKGVERFLIAFLLRMIRLLLLLLLCVLV